MSTNDEGFDENIDMNDLKDENSINAILNDQQESKMNILKNLLIFFLIICAGIGVFWGSFVLGKKVFTVSGSPSEQVAENVKIDELSEYDMPDEKVLYEIDKIDAAKEHAEVSESVMALPSQNATANVVPSPAAEPAAKPEPKAEIKVVQLATAAPAAPVAVRPAPVVVKPAPAVVKPVSTPVVVKPTPTPVVLPVVKPAQPVRVVRQEPRHVIPKPIVEKKVPVVVPSVQTTAAAKKYKVIAGSYSKVENARGLEKKLHEQGFDVNIVEVNINSVPMWRVQVGVYDTVDQAKGAIIKIKSKGNDAFYLPE